jgi:hypothetical protein
MFLVIASAAGVMATATVMFSPFIMPMSAMPMPTMHEDMHQGAGQEQQEWQIRHDMGPVLGEQEITGDGKEAQKVPVDTSCAMLRHVMLIHDSTPWRALKGRL